MGTEPKKISFGFTKMIKKVPEKIEDKKQYIDCLEGKSIKVKGGELLEDEKPLIIPLKSKTTTAASLLRIAQEVESGIMEIDVNKPKEENEKETMVIELNVKNESLDARAVRELMEDVSKSKNAKTDESASNMVIPAVELPKLTGEKESTLEDYENIPIQQFGLAMLRGMGWAPGKGMGKHKAVDLALPNLRPKGMGLGADKIAIAQKNGENNQIKKEEEELKVIVGSFIKIIAGKHVGVYGQISGFDEDSGRLIVKPALGGTNLALNEFLVQAVTKLEYQKNSKVLNTAKYEEYKKRDDNRHQVNDKLKEHIKAEKKSSHDKYDREVDKSISYSSNKYKSEKREDSRSRSHVSSKSRNDREEESSRSDSRHRRKEKQRYSSESSTDSSSDKRSRDKKRKGKKKKRDRSRSREHRRH